MANVCGHTGIPREAGRAVCTLGGNARTDAAARVFQLLPETLPRPQAPMESPQKQIDCPMGGSLKVPLTQRPKFYFLPAERLEALKRKVEEPYPEQSGVLPEGKECDTSLAELSSLDLESGEVAVLLPSSGGNSK